jgi:hypothetical protein
MTFKQNMARFVIDDSSLPSIQIVALEALEEGLDTPSLRILAGLPDNETSSVTDKYFKDALNELSFVLPDKRKAAIEVGLAIADEIIKGKRSVFDGTKDLINRAIDKYPFNQETKLYVYDSIAFEKAYGLFDTIEDLRSADYPWQPGRTNKELEQEVTEKLLAELKIWVNKMSNAG